LRARIQPLGCIAAELRRQGPAGLRFGELEDRATNQPTLWAVLRAMRIDTPLAGKGRLLEQVPEG
jgi:hypothetical protein